MSGENNLSRLLEDIEPKLNEGEYIFCTESSGKKLLVQPLMQFREEEGITLIVEKTEAEKAGINYQITFSWITLTVHSSLDAVGFTASFSTALAQNGISCNVVAGFCHDHLFVPKTDAAKALNILSKKKNDPFD